jgi:hypothetical protein
MLPAGSAAHSGPAAARASSTCHSHLSNGAGGHVSREPSSPCILGNVLIECSERAGRCEGACGEKLVSCNWRRYMDCRVSAELGKVVKVVEDREEGLEGTRIENPHKTVTCKGPATILAAYVTNGKRASLGGYKPAGHGAHSLSITLYLRKDFPGLEVMAQHN